MSNPLSARLKFLVAVGVVAALYGVSGLNMACGMDVPGQVHVVQGIATTEDGKPLAHATLYLYALTPSQFRPDLKAEQVTVVTDDQGHFTWNVPDSVTIVLDLANWVPSCWAVAADASAWQYSLHMGPRADTDDQRHDVLTYSAEECSKHWIHEGSSTLLSVVAPNMGQAALLVRGADGQPLRHHPIELFSASQFPDYEGTVVYTGTTDGDGRVLTRWYGGLRHLQVMVPGLGFASTGLFDLQPNQELYVNLPPLVPFAQMSGLVIPAQSLKGASVGLDPNDQGYSEYQWYQPTSPVDANGRWTLTDILPGNHHIVLTGISGETGSVDANVTGGENVSGLNIAPRAVRHYPLVSSYTGLASIRGTVYDPSGKPLAGAAVYVVNNQSLNISWRTVYTATTDASGKYTFTGIPTGNRISADSAQIISTHTGYSASLELSVRLDGSPVNLTLGPPNTGLVVNVVRKGEPVQGAGVCLTGLGGIRFFDFFHAASGTSPSAAKAVQAILSPSAITDANGKAVFHDLCPGVWNVTASDSGDGDIISVVRQSSGKLPTIYSSGTVQRVAVTAGQTRALTMKIYLPALRENVRVLDPDGRPRSTNASGIVLKAEVASPYGYPYASFSGTDPLGLLGLIEPGLWSVVSQYRDPPTNNLPVTTEPYYSGQALIAVSPSVPEPGPVIRVAKHGPGRINVHLQDASGHPVRGSVMAGDFFDSTEYAGSADKNGGVVFQDMPSGKYTLTAPENKPSSLPALGASSSSFPGNAALTGVTLLMPQTVTVESDQETNVIMRPEPQGYVRGKLHVPGHLVDYHLYESNYALDGCQLHIDPTTGEFIAGPFPAGKAYIGLGASGTNSNRPRSWLLAVDVIPGKVRHINLAPEGSSVIVGAKSVIMPLQNGEAADKIAGTITLADGVTAAWGARADLVLPGINGITLSLTADPSGHLVSASSWYPPQLPIDTSPESPTTPVIVSWLPGYTGAVITPYVVGQTVHIVLPSSMSVHGTVTLSGQSVEEVNSSFRIVARYQGKGRLNSILSIDTTAQADGTFDLAGLTPGTYVVQAARDGIWVSASQTITVGSGKLPDINLDIPNPGMAMDLSLVDSVGKPLPNVQVAVSLPDGPLAKELWPETLEADTAGDIHLEGLNAGQQTLTIYSASDGDTNSKPLGTVVLNVPPYVKDAPSITQVVACKQTTP